MVNYSKWDAIGDSSDDEAPSRLAQDVQTKLAVAPPEAPPRNPKAEVLTDRANQVVNSLIEKHGEDKSRLLGPDERAAYRRRVEDIQSLLWQSQEEVREVKDAFEVLRRNHDEGRARGAFTRQGTDPMSPR